MSPISFFNKHPRADFSAYLDGELTPRAIQRLEAHLAECPECEVQIEGLRETRTALRSLHEAPAPRSFSLTPEMAREARPAKPVRVRQPLQPLVNSLRITSAGLATALVVVLVIAVAGGGGNDSASDGASLTQLEAGSNDQASSEDAAGADETGAAAPQLTPMATGAGSGVGGVGSGAQPTAAATDTAVSVPVVSPDASFAAREDYGDADATQDKNAENDIAASGTSLPEAAAPASADDSGDRADTLTIVAIALASLLAATLIGALAASRFTRRGL